MSAPSPARLLAMISLFAALLLAGAAAQAMPIAPHEAHYRLKMKEIRLQGATSAQDGDFQLRIERTCTHWQAVTRFSFALFNEDGDPLHMVSQGGWTESLNGRNMEFQNQTLLNNNVIDHVAGNARTTTDGSGGVLTLTHPKATVTQLPAGIMFPIQATRWSLEQLRSGKRLVNYVVFDGGSAEPTRVMDLVAGKPKSLETIPDGAAKLFAGRQWHIVTSYFPWGNADSEPTSSHVVDIFDNGVTSHMTMDFGLVEADAQLLDIKPLPAPDCN